jgi:hypothetical protein
MAGIPKEVTRFVPGRKGRVSVVDTIIGLLWQRAVNDRLEWPELTFEEIRLGVSKALHYDVHQSTIRSTIYQHSKFFERSTKKHRYRRWRLSYYARERGRKNIEAVNRTDSQAAR